MQPVLVLPEPAALELEEYWQRAVAGMILAGPVTEVDGDAGGKAAAMDKLELQLHDVWAAVMSGLICDATYIFSQSPHVMGLPVTAGLPSRSSTVSAGTSSSNSTLDPTAMTNVAECCTQLGACSSDCSVAKSMNGCGKSTPNVRAADSSLCPAGQAVVAAGSSCMMSQVDQMLLTRLMMHLATQKLWKVMEAFLTLVATADTSLPT
jgi:hypothetical protein